jgi:FMN phosphatase YigB (HAD superfamily)
MFILIIKNIYYKGLKYNHKIKVMKIVLFDLGDTLEHNDKLLPGAFETLSNIKKINDNQNQPVILALISDFLPAKSPDEIEKIKEKYYNILDNLGIRSFFHPVNERVTLSTEIDVNKPNKEIFRYAIDKISKDLSFKEVVYITENKNHINAVREMEINGIHFKGPGQQEGEIENLIDLIPRIQKLIS